MHSLRIVFTNGHVRTFFALGLAKGIQLASAYLNEPTVKTVLLK